jgi:phospholipid transport system transporter-binding protein
MNAEVLLREDGEFGVEGAVTIDTVAATVASAAAFFNRDSHVVDLEGVTEVDSSAVSLLLEWQRAANRQGRAIRFTHMPPKLQSLVRLYGVADLVHLV